MWVNSHCQLLHGENASKRSRVGVGMNRSARGGKCKALRSNGLDTALYYIKPYLYLLNSAVLTWLYWAPLNMMQPNHNSNVCVTPNYWINQLVTSQVWALTDCTQHCLWRVLLTLSHSLTVTLTNVKSTQSDYATLPSAPRIETTVPSLPSSTAGRPPKRKHSAGDTCHRFCRHRAHW